MIHWIARAALFVAVIWLATGGAVLATDDAPAADHNQILWTTALAWLVPIGLGLLACGAAPPERAVSVIRIGWLALGISVIGYWLCGFAFQFGGLGFVLDQPDLTGLVREWAWSPPDAAWGTRWGLLGLQGYMMRGPAFTPTALSLFLSQLPWITTAVAIPLWSLQGRAGPLALFVSGVCTAFVYTLIGNWTWGGGWLTSLGLNLNLGHGFVDLAASGAVHLVGGVSALAGMLAFGIRSFMHVQAKQLSLPTLGVASGRSSGASKLATSSDGEAYVPMPPLHLPILATLGAWLVVIGWCGWALNTPAQVAVGLDLAWTEILIGLMLAVSGGAVVAATFSWLTTGQANALMTARGVIGAVIAAGAGIPFMPSWAALAVGAGAGLLVPLVQYLVEHILRLDDPTSALATHACPALWGLLAVGLFADGHAGQGWNQIGAGTYQGTAGQGVTGLLAATGYAWDWPGQFQAQAVGVAAAFLTSFFLSWLLFAAIQGLSRAWQGEYAIRLPKRPRRRRTRVRPERSRPPTARRRWQLAPFVRKDSAPERPPKRTQPEPSSRPAVLKSWGSWIVTRIKTVMTAGTRAKKRSEVSRGADTGMLEQDTGN